MTSANTVIHRLETQFERTEYNMNDIVTHMDNPDLNDIYAFNAAVRKNATASWAVSEDLRIKHNLAKAIINEIR